MFKEREFEGKDLEQALQEASTVLGIPEPDLDYKIVEQGRRGLFGVGARSVRIRVMPPLGAVPDPMAAATAEPSPALAPERPQEQQQEEAPRRRRSRGRRSTRSRRAAPGSESAGDDEPVSSEDPGDGPDRDEDSAPVRAEVSDASATEIVGTLQRMLDLMGLEIDAQRAASGNGIVIALDGPDRKALTQKDCDVLYALQFLLNRMSRRAWPDSGPIQLSCNGEGTGREDDEVIQLTREVAEQVRRTGKTKRLHPMNAYERRLVHLTVREFDHLGSRSEGSGHLKRVKIFKQDQRQV